MDLKQVKELKIKLEKNISEYISQFNKETGLNVSEVVVKTTKLFYEYRLAPQYMTLTDVEIKVEL